MAQLKKFFSKTQFILMVTVWNALAVYIPVHFHFSAPTIMLIVTVGNAIIAYVGTESGSG